MGRLLRKVLMLIVFIAPLFTNTDCKKQKKCGCAGDVLYPYTDLEFSVYFSDENSSITLIRDAYSIYTACNPDEIKPLLANFKSGDVLNVSGDIFWDCNYVMQSSSYGYSTGYSAYNIHITNIYLNMYGKK